jgi:farnesyl-diphosphate farnesyltransferase
MGLLLQKTNIIRDFREDVDDKRYFWPREIWGKAEYGFKEMKDMTSTDPEVVRRATYAQSGMVLDALRHAVHSLDYLQMLKNQSVFNFCAIPAAMAIATLELCFMNKEMFQRNIKISKAVGANVGRSRCVDVGCGHACFFSLASLSCGRRIRGKWVWCSVNTRAASTPRRCRPTPTSSASLSLVARSVFPSLLAHRHQLIRCVDRVVVRTLLPLLRRLLEGDGQADARPVRPAHAGRASPAGVDAPLAAKQRMDALRAGVANGTVSASRLQDGGKEISQRKLLLYVGAAFSVVILLSAGIIWALVVYSE